MSLFLPSTCILCGDLSRRQLDLCAVCADDLPFLNNYCKHCAKPLTAEQTVCGACLQQCQGAVRMFVLFHYQSPIDQLILRLKFNDKLINARVLGELLAEYLSKQYCQQDKPEIIIPVPLHPTRLCERGYNQALELARQLLRN